jgi:hypothetical protein
MEWGTTVELCQRGKEKRKKRKRTYYVCDFGCCAPGCLEIFSVDLVVDGENFGAPKG